MAWHYFNEETYAVLTDRFNAYMSENPNVLINEQYIAYGDYTQKLLISAAGGYLPELLVCGNNETPTYQSARLLEDITDKVNASNIYEGAFEAAKRTHQVDDRYYGVPLYVNCLALYYNTDVIDTPPTTWDELLETARAVTKGDMYGLAVCADNTESGTWQYLPWLWSAGGDIDTIDGSESVRSLSFLKQLVDEKLMSPEVITWTQGDVRMTFQTGRAAMAINGPWIRPTLTREAPELNWAVAKIPMDKQYA